MAYLASMAITPPIDLSAAVAPTLRFFGTVQSLSNNDCGNIWVRVGTEPWTLHTASLPYTGTHAGYDCWMGITTAVSRCQVSGRVTLESLARLG